MRTFASAFWPFPVYCLPYAVYLPRPHFPQLGRVKTRFERSQFVRFAFGPFGQQKAAP